MGTTFVTIDNSTGFWMRDGVLELWLRLLALHIEESPEEDFPGRRVRDQWLLASKGWFGGHVPHYLDDFASEKDGPQVIRNAIDSLLAQLKKAPARLDGPTLNLLGIEGTFVESFETCRLIEVGGAFLELMDGKIKSTARSTEFMPGSRAATRGTDGPE